MRPHLCLGATLLLAGCGTTAAALTPARAVHRGSVASCAAVTPAQQFAFARRVFVGVMLPGRTVSYGAGRVLTSPARMRVERYLKGHGPRTVRVDTAVSTTRSGIAVVEDGTEPRAGQRWKIYTDSRRQPFATSICGGSRRVTLTPGR
jgi:hypothetical protein